MNGGDGGCCLVSPGEGGQVRRDVPMTGGALALGC